MKNVRGKEVVVTIKIDKELVAALQTLRADLERATDAMTNVDLAAQELKKRWHKRHV